MSLKAEFHRHLPELGQEWELLSELNADLDEALTCQAWNRVKEAPTVLVPVTWPGYVVLVEVSLAGPAWDEWLASEAAQEEAIAFQRLRGEPVVEPPVQEPAVSEAGPGKLEDRVLGELGQNGASGETAPDPLQRRGRSVLRGLTSDRALETAGILAITAPPFVSALTGNAEAAIVQAQISSAAAAIITLAYARQGRAGAKKKPVDSTPEPV